MPTQFLLAKTYFQEIFASQKLFASCIVRQSRILVEEATRKVELQKLYFISRLRWYSHTRIQYIINNHDDILYCDQKAGVRGTVRRPYNG